MKLSKLLLGCTALSCSIICGPDHSTAEPTRISRALADESHFTEFDSKSINIANQFKIYQAKYPGNVVRGDDTAGEKIARILKLATATDNNNTNIFLLDLAAISADPVFPQLEIDDNDTSICFVIPRLSKTDIDVTMPFLPKEHPCKDPAIDFLYVEHASLYSDSQRSRTREGHLNEIGHRIVAEYVLQKLIEQGLINAPPLFQKRINVHPELNEHLASQETSD